MKNHYYFVFLLLIYSLNLLYFYESTKRNIKVKKIQFMNLMQSIKSSRNLCHTFRPVLTKYNTTKILYKYEDKSMISSKLAIFSMAYSYDEDDYHLFLNS